ncbi:unnamed protein product [Rhizophagus irregularis]|nr:unnamed protein product [Rhizophagus irregularis]
MQWIENSIQNGLIKLYKFEEFKNIYKIYDGQSVKVYSAVYKNNYCVVIKSLHYRYDNNEVANNEIIREIQYYRQMRFHNNIAKFFGVTKEGWRRFNLHDQLDIAIQIARVLLYLHDDNIFGIDIVRCCILLFIF